MTLIKPNTILVLNNGTTTWIKYVINIRPPEEHHEKYILVGPSLWHSGDKYQLLTNNPLSVWGSDKIDILKTNATQQDWEKIMFMHKTGILT